MAIQDSWRFDPSDVNQEVADAIATGLDHEDVLLMMRAVATFSRMTWAMEDAFVSPEMREAGERLNRLRSTLDAAVGRSTYDEATS